MKIIEDVSMLPEIARELISEQEHRVSAMLKPLRRMFPKIPFTSTRRIHTEASTAYERDGNTQCQGTKYNTLWMVPILRELLENTQIERQYWYQHGGSAGMYFNADFILRDSDNAVSCGRPMLYLTVAPLRLDTRKRHNGISIDCSVSEGTLTQIGLLIEQTRAEQEMFALAKLFIKGGS